MALKIKQAIFIKKDENKSTKIKKLLKKTSWEKNKPIRPEGTNK